MKKTGLAVLAGILLSSQVQAESAADGSWDFSMSSPFGQVSASVVMKTEGEALTGEFDLGDGRTLKIEKGSVEGDNIAFSITRKGMMTMTYEMSAEVQGDQIRGTAAAMGTTAPWSMTRVN